MPLINYKLRPPLFPAIQWDGEESTYNDIYTATPVPAVGPYNAEILLVKGRGQDIPVYPGMWVYVDLNGELQVLVDDDFTAKFEIV